MLAATVMVVGCGDADVALRTRDTTTAAPAAGRASRAEQHDAVRAARQRALKRIDAARKAAFERGVDYVLHGLDVVPGQDYAIAFKQGRRGYFVKDSLPMKPGYFYECPPQSPYCTATDTTPSSATLEPAPSDPCDPHYPNVCLDPGGSDYDCAGSGEDGPQYVDGPVRILNGDPFDLDGYPRDGVGCERR